MTRLTHSCKLWTIHKNMQWLSRKKKVPPTGLTSFHWKNTASASTKRPFEMDWTTDMVGSQKGCLRHAHVDNSSTLTMFSAAIMAIRHNELRDTTADMLYQVCHNVSVKLHLQPLSGKAMLYNTANREDCARLDVKANGFWGDNFHMTFDVRVFNHTPPATNPALPLACTRSMKGQRGEPTIKELPKLSMVPSHPWCFLPPEEWIELQ